MPISRGKRRIAYIKVSSAFFQKGSWYKYEKFKLGFQHIQLN